jgi:hypothetical protein
MTKTLNDVGLCAAPNNSLLALHSNNKPIVTIQYDGTVVWKDKVVDGDEEFRQAMIELSKYFSGYNQVLQDQIYELQNQIAEFRSK